MAVTHYELLGVERSASRREVHAAYRRLARQTHPDVGGDPDAFAAVAEAWRVLSTPALRTRYDATLDGEDGGDVEWGESVGFGAPVPPRQGAADPYPGPQGDDETPRKPPSPAAEPADAGADRVDPFGSGPRALPTVAALAGDLRQPRAWGRRAVLVVALVVAACLVLTAVAAVHPGLVTAAAMLGQTMFVLTLGSLALGADGARDSNLRAVRIGLDVALWVCVGGYALMAAVYATEPVAGTRDLLVRITFAGAPFLAGIALGVVLEVRARRTRRWRVANERAVRLHREADAWNEVLAALRETPGARLVRHAVDPWGRPRPVWVVVDGDGAERMWVPERAPTSWVTVLRAAGVEVHDPRESVQA